MSIDPYSYCPGGTGKKIKFCCPDLLGELGDIHRMLEGDQRLACLEHLVKLEGKFPDRACLMATRAMLEVDLADVGKAEATMARFKEKYPGNPVALAQDAILQAYRGDVKAAMESAQQALVASSSAFPPQVFQAIVVLAERLLQEGHYLAAIGHLVFLLGSSEMTDRHSAAMLSELLSSPHLPLLAKEIQPLAPPTPGALWGPAFEQALATARRGQWSDAARAFEELAQSAGDWPPIWRNIATLRLWLADTAGGIAALRKFTRQPLGSSAAPPLDDMVEAEALAQVIDTENGDYVEAVSLTYPVRDMDAVIARLSADPRAPKMEVDPAQLAKEGGPPPRLATWILDKPVAATSKGISRDQLSTVLAQVYVFGRQTDREARLELATYRDEKFDETKRVLAEILGDAIGESTGEEVLSRVSALKHALEWSWRLPEDTSPDEREALMSGELRRVFLEVWPTMKLKMLDGRTPLEAARDPAMRVPLLAAVLVVDLASQSEVEGLDFNELRGKLNLPLAGPIEIAIEGILALPLARLQRVDVGKLDNESLLLGHMRAVRNSHMTAVRHFSEELLRRPGLDAEIPKQEIYGQLARIERNPQRAIGYIAQARSAAEAAGESSASWDLTELTLRMAMGDFAEADRLMQHIRTEHIREPGVAQAMMQVLVEAGVIHPDGTPVGYPRAGGQAGLPPGGTMPASEAGKLWTPDGGSASSGEKKSVIWTPE